MTVSTLETSAFASPASFRMAPRRRAGSKVWRDRALTFAAFATVLAATFGLGPFGGAGSSSPSVERHAALAASLSE